MNHPDTLARARQQMHPVQTAQSHGSAEILYDNAIGWLRALLAEQLIDAVQHATLAGELDAAKTQCDARLQAEDAARRTAQIE